MFVPFVVFISGWSGVGGLAARPLAPPALRARSAVSCAPASITVTHFLKDLELLGPCRFVVVGPGAILETIGAFEDLRVNEQGLATVSNEDKSFECHIKTSQVKAAAFAQKASGARTLHIIRLLGEDKSSLLSLILHAGADGEVEDGAVEWWQALRTRFGDEVALLEDESVDVTQE